MDITKQTIISIATGTCGLERGLELAGVNIRVAAYVEVEAFIIANLVSAMEANKMGAAPVWVDVKTFPSESFRGKIHGITAGYPCQPFSNAGKRKGTTDPRHIFPHIQRIISTVKPVWCFFENVAGHLSMGYDEVYRSLRHLGYRVESGLFSAEEVGAPHARKRMYILAIKMEYANATTLQRIFFGNDTPLSNTGGASEMAHAHSYECGSVGRIIQEQANKNERQTQGQNRERMRREFSDSCKDVSNSGSLRSGESLQRSKSGVFNPIGFKWPAGKGEQQYDWEHPRTVKSGMGSSVNGYDFRIDLLRALGNGVVPQTAAKAFRSLLAQF